MPTIAVIGSGIAGLSAASLLAAKGYTVQVFEKNAYAGGKLGLLEADGYRFDRGPSLFTQAHLFDAHFAACGKQRSDYFSYQRLDEGTRYFWNDGTRLEAFPEADQRAREWTEQLGLSNDATERYLSRAADLYRHIGSIFLDQNIHSWRTWLHPQILNALRYLRLPYLTQTLHRYNQKTLRHPKLVQLFDRFATYNGSDPYRCPAMLSTIAHLELTEGAYYPEEGLYALPQALYRLCTDLGVQFQFDSRVDQIITEGQVVKGIEMDGVVYGADAVISNSDVVFTYQHLLNDAKEAQRWNVPERSSSGIVFYWGIAKSFPQLNLHNIFFADDYQAEFNAIKAGIAAFPDPTVYLNITSKYNPEHAPEGHENWFVLINAPSGTVDADFVAQTRQAVLQKISHVLGEDLEPLIRFEEILDPQGIADWTESYLGALYGMASNDMMAAFNRHPNQSKQYQGLYFTGGTVHPGGGIPLCMRSGSLAAQLIVKNGFLDE
ncbi:MAG: phytoene desaturase [Sphingobacteriales bacterium]|nr:MAG: phytoene desaturase [Sphingobacteriales bacterium]